MGLKFSNGVTLNADGKLRVEEVDGEWYVLGEGMSVPVDNEADGRRYLRELLKRKEVK